MHYVREGRWRETEKVVGVSVLPEGPIDRHDTVILERLAAGIVLSL